MAVETGRKVIVVGAGCAGLSAAYTLHKQGIEPIVYEAGEHTGGRCRTIVVDGYQMAVGAAVTEPQWHTTFQYLDELGLKDQIEWDTQMRLAFEGDGKIRTITIPKSFPDLVRHLPESLSFLRHTLPAKAYWHVVKAFAALLPYMRKIDSDNYDFSALAELSNLSVKDFLDRHGAPLAYEWFFYPYMSTMDHADPTDMSIAQSVALFSLMKGAVSLRGGMGSITAALYEQVENCVRLNTPVSEIVIENGTVTGVRTADGFQAADQVICCVDAPTALNLMPALPEVMRRALETCRYSKTFYYRFGLEKPILPRDDHGFGVMAPASSSSPFTAIAVDNNDPNKPLVSAAAKGWGGRFERLDEMNEEDRRRFFITEIQRVVPRFPDEPKATKYFTWHRAVNQQPPGQYVAMQDLIEHHADDVQGLYLAGEYLFLIACTEGAMNTGRQAAEKAARDYRLLTAVAAKVAVEHPAAAKA